MSGQKLTTKEMMEEGLRILKEEPAVLVRPYPPKEEWLEIDPGYEEPECEALGISHQDEGKVIEF